MGQNNLISIDLSMLIQMINFFIMVFVFWKFFGNKIGKVLEQRRKISLYEFEKLEQEREKLEEQAKEVLYDFIIRTCKDVTSYYQITLLRNIGAGTLSFSLPVGKDKKVTLGEVISLYQEDFTQNRISEDTLAMLSYLNEEEREAIKYELDMKTKVDFDEYLKINKLTNSMFNKKIKKIHEKIKFIIKRYNLYSNYTSQLKEKTNA